MKSSAWGWLPERSEGIWRFGPRWFRPFAAAIPYLTVIFALVMLWFSSGSITSTDGLLFDLPECSAADGEPTSLVALVMPMRRDTMIFFDDSRYIAGDNSSLESFREHLSERLVNSERKTLLVLADRRVAGGVISKIADIAKRSGSERILLATRKTEEDR